MNMRASDEFEYYAVGDIIEVDDWQGTVTAVEVRRSRARVKSEDGEYILRLGQTLADAEFIAAEKKKADARDDDKSAKNSVQGNNETIEVAERVETVATPVDK